MNSDKSEVQEVLVDVPKYDKDGNPITLHSLSSGGARNAHGSLIAQYSNPRLPESANESYVDREFYERTTRENDARRRRADEAEERRRRENFERSILVIDKYVIPFTKTYIVPRATELWETKVLPEGRRLAQRWLRPNSSQPEAPVANPVTHEFAADIAKSPATSKHTIDHTTEVSTVQLDGEDTPLADVIQLDEYQNHRSA